MYKVNYVPVFGDGSANSNETVIHVSFVLQNQTHETLELEAHRLHEGTRDHYKCGDQQGQHHGYLACRSHL